MEPQFCLLCGARLTKIQIESHLHFECSKCDYIHWLNSRPCVDAIIAREGAILFTQRGVEPHKGDWDLPGGFLELGEAPIAGLHREIAEELGARIEILKFIGHYVDGYGDDPYIKTLNCSYLCKLLSPVRFTDDDVVGYDWFPVDNLPPNIAFAHFKKVFEDCYEDIVAAS
ncbi:NUDIX hydrolase [candidate division KSB1 bacterium]|nr:NUDIX hydrolase [candidate division KSB1 bacterium]